MMVPLADLTGSSESIAGITPQIEAVGGIGPNTQALRGQYSTHYTVRAEKNV